MGLVPSSFQISREMSLIILYIGGIQVFSIRNLPKSTVPELGLKKSSYSMTVIRIDLIRYDIIDCTMIAYIVTNCHTK